MIRPRIVNISALNIDQKIHIDAYLSLSPLEHRSEIPISSFNLLSKRQFRVKLIAMDDKGQTAFSREFDTDHFGQLSINIPSSINDKKILSCVLFETSLIEYYDFYLGSFIPLILKEPKKIIITDFDKTLVDTKYSSLKEVYYSLNKPLSFFPEVKTSTELFKNFIKNDYQPFIISASPHFYEKAINHWLSTKQIFVHQIQLKDYRNFFTFYNHSLFKKDIKNQGFYKLSKILNTLSIIGIPEKLVLMGDGFESDTFIYLTLAALINKKAPPWELWNSIKENHQFMLNNKQSTYFLTQFSHLQAMAQKRECDLKIYIRATENNYQELKNKTFQNHYIEDLKHKVEYYIA